VREVYGRRETMKLNAAKVFWPTLYKPVRTEHVTSKDIAAVGFATSHVCLFRKGKDPYHTPSR
jgi:hypothetical protein